MAEYQLYCFAQSGNAYRAALMLNLIGADWQPVFVDFFKGETRTADYRSHGQRNGRSAGARSRREEAQPVRRDPDISRRTLRKILAARRRRAARSVALDHFRQSEGQRLSWPLPLPAQFRQAARRSGRAWNSSKAASTMRSPSSTSACRRSPYLLGAEPTIADMSLIELSLLSAPTNSASISPPNTRTSPPGSTASRRCPAGGIPTI